MIITSYFQKSLLLLVSIHLLGSLRLIQCADDPSDHSPRFLSSHGDVSGLKDAPPASASSSSSTSLSHGVEDETVHPHSPNPEPYQVTYADGTKSPWVYLKNRGRTPDEGGTLYLIYEETLDGYTVKQCAKSGKYEYLDVDEESGTLVETGLVAGIDDPMKNGIPVQAARLSHKIRVQRIKSKPNIFNPDGEDGSDGDGSGRTRTLHEKIHDTTSASGATSLMESNAQSPRRRAVITTGTLKNLVVPFRFSDHTSRTLPTTSQLSILMNNVGPDASLCPTGSVRDVYLESSFNQLDIESTVVDWVTIDYTESTCAGGNSGLTTSFFNCITNALDKVVANGVNFGDYDLDNNGYIDGITFFHSGYAAEFGGTDIYGVSYSNRIWSHKWAIYTTNWSNNGVRVYEYHMNPSLYGTSGSSIGRIGVVAHETGHFLGLPDLYDYGDDTYGDGSGIGSFGLMANSWGFSNDQYYPPLMSAWSKYKLGWVNPTIVSSSGTYSLGQACDNADMILLNTGFPSGEYLLIENRQPCGFESTMPQGGLAIFHIDDNANNIRGYPDQGGWPTNGNHYEVALLQADGDYDLENNYGRGDSTDLFHAGGVYSIGPSGTSSGDFYPNTNAYQSGTIIDTQITISNISAAGSTMTFDITIGGSTPPSPTTATPTAFATPSTTFYPTAPFATPPPSESETITSSGCVDSSLSFRVLWNGQMRKKDCAWVNRKNTNDRCAVDGVSAICSSTCAGCANCVDTSLRFKVTLINGREKNKDCDWVKKRPNKRCGLVGVTEACCATC